MKKIAVCFLAALLATGMMTGCLDDDTSYESGTSAGTSQVSNDPSPEDAYQHGTVDGKTYTSQYFGYTLTIPEAWEFETEEQLLERGEITERTDSDTFESLMTQVLLINDAYASDPSVGASISVMCEDQVKEGYDPKNATFDEITESCDIMFSTQALDGRYFKRTGRDTLQRGDKTYLKLTYEISFDDGSSKIMYTYVRVVGRYLMLIVCLPGTSGYTDQDFEQWIGAV